MRDSTCFYINILYQCWYDLHIQKNAFRFGNHLHLTSHHLTRLNVDLHNLMISKPQVRHSLSKVNIFAIYIHISYHLVYFLIRQPVLEIYQHVLMPRGLLLLSFYIPPKFICLSPSISASRIMSSTSSSVIFSPTFNITRRMSEALIRPLPSLSNTLNASFNSSSVCRIMQLSRHQCQKLREINCAASC